MNPTKRLANLIDRLTNQRISALEARDFARDEELKSITDELAALSEEIEGLGQGGGTGQETLPVKMKKKPGPKPGSKKKPGPKPKKQPGPKPGPKPKQQVAPAKPAKQTAPAKPVGRPTKLLFPEGATITTVHNGETITVSVLADGLQWKGKKYPSLVKLAEAVTGLKTSGLRNSPRWKIVE